MIKLLNDSSDMDKVRRAVALSRVGLPTYSFASELIPLGVEGSPLANVSYINRLMVSKYDEFCLRTDHVDVNFVKDRHGEEPFQRVATRRPFFIFHGMQKYTYFQVYDFLKDYHKYIKEGRRFSTEYFKTVLDFKYFPHVLASISGQTVRIAMMESWCAGNDWNATAGYWVDDRGNPALIGEVNPNPKLNHRQAMSSGKEKGVIPLSEWNNPDKEKLFMYLRTYGIPGIMYEVSKLGEDRIQFWDISEDSSRVLGPWGRPTVADVDLVSVHLDKWKRIKGNNEIEF